MPQQQIYIGNFGKGLTNNVLPFNIDNDAFPYMQNFYTWRGRARRKRGTVALSRLSRQIQSVDPVTLPWQFAKLALVAGVGNLITGPWTQGTAATVVTIEANASIVPGSLQLTVGGILYTEPSTPDGTLLKAGVADPGSTINYSMGAITIASGGASLTGTFAYYPDLPVLGLESLISASSTSKSPLTMAFDTTYSYQINQLASSPTFYSTSYYKNTNNPVTWSNTDDNQFWSTNYQSAFWVTNNKPGFHFKLLTSVNTVQSASATRANFNLTNHGLIAGDYIFINEVTGPIGSGAAAGQSINGLTGIIVAAGLTANSFNADFTGANGTSLANFVVGALGQNGIAQYLTNSIAGQDGIKWYDGDPSPNTGLPSGTGLGWVNFAPPLTASNVSINDLSAATYYLVGALAIVPFKDRLLFFAPQIQTSTGAVIQKAMQDVVIWSWNGTPYYNALVPSVTGNETYDVSSYYVDQTGKAGWTSAGINKPIVTVISNEDVLLVGFGSSGRKTRLVYTGNDINPFLFYLINSEFPSYATFSGITLDKGGIEIGPYGITVTTQQDCQRIDLQIPDKIFEIQTLTLNGQSGANRINAIRDFQKEWIYFSYPTGDGKTTNGSWLYPSQTLLYNYRDNAWAVFRENFTRHGLYRRGSHYTWATLPFKTWREWTEPWNAGSTQAQYPNIVAGNPQGYVVIKGEGTGEAPSGYIAAITQDSTGDTNINSVNHCVNVGDYLSFGGFSIGKVSSTPDANNFVVDIPFPSTANITGATNATKAVLTLSWPTPVAEVPAINTYFVGQRVSIAGVGGMVGLNGNTYTVLACSPTTITLNVDTTAFGTYTSGGSTTLVSYIGLGNYSKLSTPLLQTKQFPVFWEQGKQVTLNSQKYLLDSTATGQATINISLSQDPVDIWNNSPVIPSSNVTNSGLVYSNIIYTCPESTNLGLTAANSNLQTPIASTAQKQIWHRMNTSLTGDTFQIGLTLSDVQMRNITYATNELTLHAMQLTVSPGPTLI